MGDLSLLGTTFTTGCCPETANQHQKSAQDLRSILSIPVYTAGNDTLENRALWANTRVAKETAVRGWLVRLALVL